MPKNQDYLVSLDLGSRATRCLVALEEQSRLRFISYGQSPARGWERGRIADQDAVIESVGKAVDEAEANGGMVIDSAVVGVGGPQVDSNRSSSAIRIPSWEDGIQEHHVAEAVRVAGRAALSDERAEVQTVPLEFGVDNESGIRRPNGMRAKRLGAQVRVISSAAQAHHNVCAVVNRAGLVVEETVFEGFAAAYSVLEAQARTLGVAVADIGQSSIELVAYTNDDLRLAKGLGIGGDQFVNDVASVLRTPPAEAERLIWQYGCADSRNTPLNAQIEVPGLPHEPSRHESKRYFNEILEARAEDVFELVGAELRGAGLQGQLVAGLVLTGGLAGLAALCEVSERMTGLNTRIGLPTTFEDLPVHLDHPAWSSAIGLVWYSARLRRRRVRRKERITEWLKSLID